MVVSEPAALMQGEMSNPGVVPRAIQDVFDIIEKTPGRDFLLRMSMMEIYNEVVWQRTVTSSIVKLYTHESWAQPCKYHQLELQAKAVCTSQACIRL